MNVLRRFGAWVTSLKHSKKKQSIRTQLAQSAIILIAATILICILTEVLFLERVYRNDKKQSLVETYEWLNVHAVKENLASEDFLQALSMTCDKYNLKIIVLDQANNAMVSSAKEVKELSSKLLQYRFGFLPKAELLESQGRYFVWITNDSRTDTEDMEIWGQLDNGYIFLFTTPLESIEESAVISIRFLTIIGASAIAIGGLVAWFYSRKISKPILELAQVSERMIHLDFEAKYIGTEKNEIGILGKNMNSLSFSLEKTISELKTANMELQKDIQKKEEIDKQRQEFIGNVSHELKTPIALIKGYAEGLQEGITDDPESMSYYLEVICDEAERMNRMVKSLLTLNELESGNQHIHMERVDLAAMIRNYVNSAEILAREKEAEILVIGPDSLYAWGDEFKIEEVIMNYVSNAIRYVGGERKKIQITLEQIGDKARVTVFNTGSPISEEDKVYIWDKFYKVDKARTRACGGSGIGLSIVKAIMTGLGQAYGVENVEGGVSFWFELSMV